MRRPDTRTLAVLLAITCLAGCLTPKQYVPTARFMIDPEITVQHADPTSFSIGIRPLEAGRPYRQQLVRREDDLQLTHYEHAEWADLPRDIVTQALLDAVRLTNRFADVAYSHDMGAPDLLLIGTVRAFEQVQAETGPAALCSIDVQLRAGISRDGVWQAILSSQIPMPEEGPSGLAKAMSRAVASIAAEAANQIAEIDPARFTP